MFFVTCRGLFWWKHGGAKPLPLVHPEMGSLLAVYRDPQKRLWVGMSHGVMQLVPHGDGFEQVPNRQVRGPVSAMAGDQDGNLWVGTRTHGVWRLAPDRSVSYWSTPQGLANNSIRSIYVDDEQNLWIGMLNGGLARWRKAPLIAYGVPEGLPAEYAANVLRGPNGDLWLGTWGKGLFRLHQGRLYPETLSGMRTTQPIRALALDMHGKLWVGTWFDGLYRYDGDRFHHYLLGTESPANAVSAVAGDHHGALWIGTYTGLIRFAGGVPEPGKGDLLLQNRLITCLEEDSDGSMLVGTADGLYRVRNGQAQAVAGLSQPYVLSISRDTFGSTWVGTKAGGLDLLAGDSVRHLDRTSGIPDNPVSSLVEDGYGFMWMGTTRGILRVSARDLDDLARGKQATIQSVLYGKSDGMRSSECGSSSQPTAALASDGSVWFATAKGFVHSNPETAYLQSPPPVVRLEGFRLDGAPTVEAKVLKLPAGLNDLVIHFNAKRLADPGQLVFRYRMDGYNKEWKETQDRSAHYGRLLPGRYEFEVEARNAGDAWNGIDAEVEINQQAFFYQTLWFRLLLLVPLCLLAVKLFRWRVARVKGELGVVLEERYRIARDWHDTLMAEFAAISWQLESTARLLRDDSVGGKHPAAVKSCELARSMVSHCQAEARRIIWDLRESDHATPMLSEALSRTLSATATQDRIDMQLRVIGKEVPLAQRYIHHLVCIGQEAVTNALRHAQPKTISIRLHYADTELKISVRDDGCGFNSSTSANVTLGHFGIPVMEERARKLGGSLRVETATGSGTEVLVSIPFLVPTLSAGAKA